MTSNHAEFAASHPRQDPFAAELARIRAAYSRRNREIPRERYSSSNPRAAIFQQETERRILDLLTRRSSAPIASQQTLDLGCGEGRWLRRLQQWGAAPENLAGVDLLPERIATAREYCAPQIRLTCGNADQLPFASASLDIILCITVFSSILDSNLREAVAAEMQRVLRSGGFVVWHDFFVNNPRNRDVRGVRKSEIRRLFPECEIELARITVAAPLGRAIAKMPRLYSALAKCRVFSTHYLGYFRRKP